MRTFSILLPLVMAVVCGVLAFMCGVGILCLATGISRIVTTSQGAALLCIALAINSGTCYAGSLTFFALNSNLAIKRWNCVIWLIAAVCGQLLLSQLVLPLQIPPEVLQGINFGALAIALFLTGFVFADESGVQSES